MKWIIAFLLLITLSCEEDSLDITLLEGNIKLDKTLRKDPKLRFEWKKALVGQLLQDRIESEKIEITQTESDKYMDTAAKDLNRAGGIVINGVVLHIKNVKDRSQGEKKVLREKLESMAQNLYLDLQQNPTEASLRNLSDKLDLPKGTSLSLKVGLKILAPSQVAKPGWIEFGKIFDSHRSSELDAVAKPVSLSDGVFVTILKERIETQELKIDDIRKGADAIALSKAREKKLESLLISASKDTELYLFPEVIRKEGEVE